jgi:hypothetical protein
MHCFLRSSFFLTLLVSAALAVPFARGQAQGQPPAAPAGAPQHHVHHPGQPPHAPGTAAPAASPANVPGPASQFASPSGAPQRDHLPLPRTAPIASVSRSPKNTAGEEFFIIASIDPTHSQVLLKHPTEVTELMQLTPSTKYLDENDKPIHLQDFRAGDTVWVASSGNSLEPKATRIQKGQMTVADLHRYYLDYPEIK